MNRWFSHRIPTSDILFNWFFLLTSFAVQAQMIERPNIEVITEKEGLPFNYISTIVKDKRGFLWIGSAEGLARYDGYSFRTIQKNRGSSLPSNIIVSLAVDQEGMIWIGHLGGYISCLDPITLKIWYTKIPGAEELPVQKIFFDSQGKIYCFVDHIGLHRYDEKTKSFTFVASLNHLPEKGLAPSINYNRVSDIYEDETKTFWFATANGIYRFHPSDSVFHHMSSLGTENDPASIHRLLPDGEGGFWCSSYGDGLIHYNVKGNKFISYLFERGYPGTSNIIYGITRKSESEIWVATSSQGLGIFNLTTKKFSFFQADSQVGLACSSMLLDQSGILWIVSDKGLMKWNIRESRFLFSKLRVSKSDNHAYYGVEKVFIDEPTGRKIIGTSYADGIHIFDSTKKEFILPIGMHANGEPYQITKDIICDKAGNIFVLTRDYLYQLTRNNQLIKIEGINKLLNPDQVPYFFRMMQSGDGDLWVCSSRNGLFRFDSKQKKWERFSEEIPNTLAENRIYGVLEDKQHRIWLPHLRAGVTVYDPAHKSFQNFRHTNKDSTSLISNIFSDITQTPDGEIWISTFEGISIFNERTNSFRNLNILNGLPTEILASIDTDDEGNIWASTNIGLIRIERKSHAVSQFNINDGLQGIYSNFKLMKGSHGQLFICTIQGYYTFDPKELFTQKKYESPVFITAIKNLNNSITDSTRQVRIDYESNSLSIEFAALNYLNPLKNRYRYKMDGLENAWSETANHVVTYSGIPSGSYTFRIQLVGNDKPNEGVIKVIVATPFWKQNWFRFLLVGFGIAGVYAVYRIRLSQIRQEEKLKAEFNQKLADVEMKALKAQMSPHFIFNSLNSINRYIVKSEPEKASLYLTKFSKLIRLILDNSNNKIISLEQELNAIRLYIDLEMLRFDDKFSYTIAVSKDINPLSIGVPPMIIQPFVENAIWHGLLHKETRGLLDIKVSHFGSGLQCVVTDNGVGRKKAAELKSKSVNKEKSYGMKITKERLNMLNGESTISAVEIIDMIDVEGNSAGTKVIVKIMTAEMEPEF